MSRRLGAVGEAGGGSSAQEEFRSDESTLWISKEEELRLEASNEPSAKSEDFFEPRKGR